MDSEKLRTQVEWLAVRLIGGNYGIGAELSLFTIRAPYFVWEILRGGGGGGGPGFGKGLPNSAGAGYVGTALGVQIPLDPHNRHELRFLTGVFGGAMAQRLPDPPGSGYGEGAGYICDGPFVLLEAGYVHHILQRFAVQAGVELLVPTKKMDGTAFDGGDGHSGENHGKPDVMLMGFVGFRI